MGRLEDKAISEGNTTPIVQPLTVKYRKYLGEYVAILSNTGKVIAHSKDPGKVIDEARKKGIEVPAIVYVPYPNITSEFNEVLRRRSKIWETEVQRGFR